MTQIGQFIRTATGFSGRIRTLGLDAEITLVPLEPADAEHAPDYRVLLSDDDGAEIGAGWTHVGERAGEYVSLQIDGPLLERPLRANLFRSGVGEPLWSLHWYRQSKPREGER